MALRTVHPGVIPALKDCLNTCTQVSKQSTYLCRTPVSLVDWPALSAQDTSFSFGPGTSRHLKCLGLRTLPVLPVDGKPTCCPRITLIGQSHHDWKSSDTVGPDMAAFFPWPSWYNCVIAMGHIIFSLILPHWLTHIFSYSAVIAYCLSLKTTKLEVEEEEKWVKSTRNQKKKKRASSFVCSKMLPTASRGCGRNKPALVVWRETAVTPCDGNGLIWCIYLWKNW